MDYLRQLLQEAHREYQDYVATGVMTARVFALQFLDGHHYADSRKAARKNIHRKVMGAIGILLLERTDLIKQFFSKPSLETEAIDRIIVLVYTEQRYDGSSNVETRKIKLVRPSTISLNCRIKKEDMILLADCANDAAFFRNKIDATTISDLLHCRLSAPLVAENIMGLAYFLDQLSAIYLIGRNWQTVLEHCGAILLQDGNKPQSHTNFSSALNRAKHSLCFKGVDMIDATLAHIRKKNL